MIQPIILAAGKGTRMRSERPKTLFEIEGKPMLGYILDTIEKIAVCLPPIVVVGHGKEEVIAYVGSRGMCVEQTELSGTASAVRIALPSIPVQADAVLVLYGDQPFIKKDSIERMVAQYENGHPVLVQSSLVVEDFKNEREVFAAFGRIVRSIDGKPQRIVEYKNASEEERALHEVNPGTCIANMEWLTKVLPTIEPDPISGEYYLTHLLELASKNGQSIVTVDVALQDALGINSPEDAERAKHLVV